MGSKSRYREVLKLLTNRPRKTADSTYPPHTRPLSLKSRPDDTVKAYEIIPTQKELEEMEHRRSRTVLTALYQASKPPVVRQPITLATATREQVVNALHKVQFKRKAALL